MLLSIGMIVKNEEQYLRRCLEALVPVLQQLDSELIVVDTGSTDSTVEIAREFTDKVYSFEWCNDFSAARNAGLKRAKGEWFLFLDADEIFADVGKLIEFFTSGEYKRYNAATYVVRNSNDAAHKKYSDTPIIRMTKRFDDTKFKNIIHEILDPIRGSIKALEVIALHYGYVNDDAEFIQKKTERNLALLQHQLERDPRNSKHNYDICKTYLLAGEYEKGLEYCDKGLKYAVGQAEFMQGALHYTKVQTFLRLNKYPEALQAAEDYFHSRTKKGIYDLEMYHIQGEIHFENAEYREAITAFQKYLEALKLYQQGAYQGKEVLVYEEFRAKPSSLRLAVYKLAKSLMEEREYDSAVGYLKTFSVSAWYEEALFRKLFLELEFDLMKRRADFSRLLELLPLFGSTEGAEALQEAIETELRSESEEQILAVFAQAEGTQEYVRLNQLRYRHRYRGDLTRKAVEGFIASAEEWKPVYADALYFAVYYGCDVKLISQKVYLYELKGIIWNAYLHFEDLPLRILEMQNHQATVTDARNGLWQAILCFGALTSGKQRTEETLPLLRKYAAQTRACIERLYKKESQQGSLQDLMPLPLRVGQYLGQAMQAKTREEMTALIKCAEMLCPEIAMAVSVLEEEWTRGLQERERAELERYAAIVKKNICTLMQDGNLEEADGILREYEKIYPEDEEIQSIKSQMGRSAEIR